MGGSKMKQWNILSWGSVGQNRHILIYVIKTLIRSDGEVQDSTVYPYLILCPLRHWFKERKVYSHHPSIQSLMTEQAQLEKANPSVNGNEHLECWIHSFRVVSHVNAVDWTYINTVGVNSACLLAVGRSSEQTGFLSMKAWWWSAALGWITSNPPSSQPACPDAHHVCCRLEIICSARGLKLGPTTCQTRVHWWIK